MRKDFRSVCPEASEFGNKIDVFVYLVEFLSDAGLHIILNGAKHSPSSFVLASPTGQKTELAQFMEKSYDFERFFQNLVPKSLRDEKIPVLSEKSDEQ